MEMISVHNSRFCAQPHSKERAFTSCAVALENPQTYTSSFHQITLTIIFSIMGALHVERRLRITKTFVAALSME